MASKENHREDGFSLVEVLTALVLLGIVLSLAAPSIDLDSYRMQGSMRSFGTQLLVAQREAVQREHDVVVGFDVANGTVRIHSDANNNSVIDAGEKVRVEPLGDGAVFGRGGAPAITADDADDVSFTRTSNELPVVIFRRSGSASEEGTIYLTSSRGSRSDEYANDARAVRIDRSTGRIYWMKYDAAGWVREH